MMSERVNKAALRYREPMARHTTWRVGGPADIWFAPTSREQLIEFIRAHDQAAPLTFVGLGSNLLVRDGGIRGAVIATGAGLGGIDQPEPGIVHVGAGVPCTVLARRCSRWGIGPAGFFAGIPGSVGGALRMNAGAFGGETWDSVLAVEVVNRQGEVRVRERAEYEPGYRHVRGPATEEWFLAGHFAFAPEPADSHQITDLLAERRARQPLGLPSCGSVFRNPPGDHAARLIEAAGLKGQRIGGAEVSSKHANFIINTGDASAADIEALILHVQATVAATSGIRLETEVQIIGEPAAAPGGDS